MAYHGIIFDFNGTLIHDSDKHEAAWQAMALKLRGRSMSREELRIRMHGRPNRDIAEYLAGKKIEADRLAAIVREKEESYREMMRRDPEALRLVRGAVELLDFLKAKRIPRAIATSSEETNLRFYLDAFGLGRWFERDWIVFDDGSFAGKPAPDIFRLSAARIGLAPADCVVCEDALSGLEAARRAGAGRIVAVGPPEKHDDLRRVEGVDEVIADFTEFDRGILCETV